MAAVLPDVQGPLVLVGADGTAVQSTQAPSFAFSYDPRDPAVDVVAGRAPADADEIAVESASLAASGLAIGDATSVVVGGEVRPVTVVGEIGLGAALAGATVVFLDPETAEAAFAPDGTVATDLRARGRRADRAAAGGPARSRPGRARASRRRRSPGTRCASSPPRTSSRSSGSSRRSCWSSRGSRCSSAASSSPTRSPCGSGSGRASSPCSGRSARRRCRCSPRSCCRPRSSAWSARSSASPAASAWSSCSAGCSARFGMELTGRVPLDGFTLVVSVLVGTLVSVLAAALPARRAALVPPVEALRDEVLAARALADPTGRRGDRAGGAGRRRGRRRAARPDRGPRRSGARDRCGRGGPRGARRVAGAGARVPAGGRPPVRRLAPGGSAGAGQRHPQPPAHGEHRGRPHDRDGPRGRRRRDRGDHPGVDQRHRHAGGHHRLHPARGRAGHGAGAGGRRRPGAARRAGGRHVRDRQRARRRLRVRRSPASTPTAVGRSIRTEVVEGDFPAALAAGEVAVQRTTMDDEDWSLGQELELVGSSGADDAHDRRRHRLARVRGAVRRVAGRARPALPARRAAGDHGLRHGGRRGRRRRRCATSSPRRSARTSSSP